MKKEKVKLRLDDLEIESFETKVAPIVMGACHNGTCQNTCQSTCSSIHSCQHSSCAAGGNC